MLPVSAVAYLGPNGAGFSKRVPAGALEYTFAEHIEFTRSAQLALAEVSLLAPSLDEAAENVIKPMIALNIDGDMGPVITEIDQALEVLRAEMRRVLAIDTSASAME